MLLASAPAYLAATHWQPRHRLYAAPDNVPRLEPNGFRLLEFGLRRRLQLRSSSCGSTSRVSFTATPATLRTILRPNDVDVDAFSHVESLFEIYVPPSRASTLARLSSLEQELSLRSDQVAALVQVFDSPTTVICRLADSARLEADASKSASSVPSAPDSDGLAGES
eukprot:6213018-Pleurochrysis_carterae.AAC.1